MTYGEIEPLVQKLAHEIMLYAGHRQATGAGMLNQYSIESIIRPVLAEVWLKQQSKIIIDD